LQEPPDGSEAPDAGEYQQLISCVSHNLAVYYASDATFIITLMDAGEWRLLLDARAPHIYHYMFF
jgi:hypothetical protein